MSSAVLRSRQWGFVEVDERVDAGFRGQGDEVGSESRPGRFVDEAHGLAGSCAAIAVVPQND